MAVKAGGIPRYRSHGGAALFAHGFRPFFLGAGVWAVVALVVWLAAFFGGVGIPTVLGPLAWHVHEMLFGYVAAVIAGFVLTAVPNWTGRLPLQGTPLALLFGAWLVDRVATGASTVLGAPAAAGLDLAFLTALVAVVGREILAGRNWRNLPVLAALTGLLAANALVQLEAVGGPATAALGTRLGLAVVVALIALIGGRVVPSFTRNWLRKRERQAMPAPFGCGYRVALAVLLAALVAWVAAPASPVAGMLLVAAGAGKAWRLARWRGLHTGADALVWSLHAGFAWLPVGLVLLGLAVLWPGVPASAGLHALTVGAMGAMTLAVMTRATLGHLGRPLSADRATAAIYLGVAAAAVLRVAAALAAATNAYVGLLLGSGALWVAAFGLFSLHYGRLLVRRRNDSH